MENTHINSNKESTEKTKNHNCDISGKKTLQNSREQPSTLSNIFNNHRIKTLNILKGTSRRGHPLLTPLPSRRRYRTIKKKTILADSEMAFLQMLLYSWFSHYTAIWRKSVATHTTPLLQNFIHLLFHCAVLWLNFENHFSKFNYL